MSRSIAERLHEARKIAQSLRSTNKDNGDLTNKVVALTDENGALKANLTNVTVVSEELKANLANVTAFNGQLTNQVTALTDENGALKSNLTSVIDENGALKSNLTSVIDENKNLTADNIEITISSCGVLCAVAGKGVGDTGIASIDSIYENCVEACFGESNIATSLGSDV